MVPEDSVVVDDVYEQPSPLHSFKLGGGVGQWLPSHSFPLCGVVGQGWPLHSKFSPANTCRCCTELKNREA